ncbi:MAG: hypothetical protein EOS41_12310 [Mesorhizobium sp.]|uniref:hypothetical protein n=1 Tax=Mesorhizobium sp. TaxID=1871066 RepID=UPI000FE5BCA4|nr:hypothetical protein [Mesorhizobium sp.]RWE25224.1 MAG: hypothetical protein EOS41_12310 [Mesorhizobium sp.]
MPIFANVMDVNLTGSEAAFVYFNQPQVMIELIDHSAKAYVINLDQKVYVTPAPARHLTLAEQKTLDVAWKASAKVRQVIKI